MFSYYYLLYLSYRCTFAIYFSLPSSNNGRCMTMSQMAPYVYNKYKQLAGYVYDSPWDAKFVLCRIHSLEFVRLISDLIIYKMCILT